MQSRACKYKRDSEAFTGRFEETLFPLRIYQHLFAQPKQLLADPFFFRHPLFAYPLPYLHRVFAIAVMIEIESNFE